MRFASHGHADARVDRDHLRHAISTESSSTPRRTETTTRDGRGDWKMSWKDAGRHERKWNRERKGGSTVCFVLHWEEPSKSLCLSVYCKEDRNSLLRFLQTFPLFVGSQRFSMLVVRVVRYGTAQKVVLAWTVLRSRSVACFPQRRRIPVAHRFGVSYFLDLFSYLL